ncbi:Uncharacterised protein [Vibrio cholerae]|nr:Uncharacterised protein [Vibrio cholerae]
MVNWCYLKIMFCLIKWRPFLHQECVNMPTVLRTWFMRN